MKTVSLITVLVFSVAVRAQQTQVLTLVKGECNGAGCEYVFVDSAGTETRVDWIPAGVVNTASTDIGNYVIDNDLNIPYRITFALKKIYDEVSDTMSDELVIQSMERMPVKIYHEEIILLEADCEMLPCVFTFQLKNGAKMLAMNLPFESSFLQTTAQGKTELVSDALTSVYEAVYTIKKEYDYSTDTYFDMLVFTELKKKN
jgi:hypothetical protein